MILSFINERLKAAGFPIDLSEHQLDGNFHVFKENGAKLWAKAIKRNLADGRLAVQVHAGNYHDKSAKATIQVLFRDGQVDDGKLDRKSAQELKRIEKATRLLLTEKKLEVQEFAESLWHEWSQRRLKDEPGAYLKRKGFATAPESTIVIDNYEDNQKVLCVPMYDNEGRLWNIQKIYTNGFKPYLKGGRGEDTLHTLKGDHTETILVAEGFATALAVHEATGYETLCAFSAGNLEYAVQHAKSAYPGREVIVCADWDGATFAKADVGKNVGMLASRECALKFGVRVSYPDPGSTPDRNIDFADLWPNTELIAHLVRSSYAYSDLREREFEKPKAPKVKKVKADVVFEPLPGGLEHQAVFEGLVDEKRLSTGLNGENNPALSLATETESIGGESHAQDVSYLILPPEKKTADYEKIKTLSLPDRTEKNMPLPTLNNMRYIADYVGATLRYNVIKKDQEWFIPGESASVDNYKNVLRARFTDLCVRARMPVGHIDEFLTYLCEQNQFNPVAAWITSKPWDGVYRFEKLLQTVKVRDESSNPEKAKQKETFIRKWMTMAVKAALSPTGLACPGMLVFQGPQYIGKTRWMMSLTPPELDLAAESKIVNPSDKDSVKQTVRYWLVELGEIGATFRKSDVEALKAFITRGQDMFRAPYARAESQFARRTVFFGSVNDENFLVDKTGNRRYWTLDVEHLDWNHGLDMQAIWAEIYDGLQKGQTWYLDQAEMDQLNHSNQSFETVEPLKEQLELWGDWEAPVTQNGSEWLTATQVLMRLGRDNPTNGDTQRVSAIIRKLSRDDDKHRRLPKTGTRVLWVPKKTGPGSH